MKYRYVNRLDNVHLIDTKMFGFINYQSSYIVAGQRVALIDTGAPLSLKVVKEAINRHGFSIPDIECIFVTHCEHPDHAGNVGALLRENRKARVCISEVGVEYLTNPEIEAAKRRAVLSPTMAARFGEQIPVPKSRIQFLKEGDVFDLGQGEKLRIMMAPGHQPSGLVVFEEKNNGLFINDLVGNYFPDANVNLILTPSRADVRQTMAALKKFQEMDISHLYLGHFGIHSDCQAVIQKALNSMQMLMDIAEQCVREGRPGEICPRVFASKLPEVERLIRFRGQELGEYTRDELNKHHAEAFAQYYLAL
jgi:glyoxylase-like metal-dependent hydrolase (beta-lactamase superfamily II)